MTAFSAITSSFQAVNFSPVAGSSHKRSASEAQLSGAGSYSPASPSSGTTTRPPSSFAQITSSPFQSNNDADLANGDHFSRAHQGFGGMYFETSSPSFLNYSSSQSLPLLRNRRSQQSQLSDRTTTIQSSRSSCCSCILDPFDPHQ